MTSPTDVLELSAIQVAGRIRRGELGAEDYMACALERHRQLEHLNAVTWIDPARALESARQVDLRRNCGESPGALAGLPVIVKDNIDVAGAPTAGATASLAWNVPANNAPVLDRLLAAGAVLFGKANMHELAGGGTSSNPTTGCVRNPYDPARIPGGSSGGTAAAIAARIVPAGLGTDTAGSVRIPAALCGIAALRPSIFGGKLYADAGVLPLAADLDTIGPMARSVADVALLHAAVTGRPMPAPIDLAGVRIGIPRGPYWESLASEVGACAEAALARLRAAGALLVEVDTGGYYAAASAVYATLVMHGIKADLAGYLRRARAPVSAAEVVAGIASRDTRLLFERAAAMQFTAAELDAARTGKRAQIVAAYEGMLRVAGLAAIAFPTEPMTAPLINSRGDTADDLIEVNGEPVNEVLALIRNTHVTGALGVPGLSVAMGLSTRGLPVGLELDGWNGRDGQLLALGMAVEQILGPIAPPARARTQADSAMLRTT